MKDPGNTARFRYTALNLTVIIAGISQGLLLSLLAIILEKQGISSSMNSMNALGLYAGILLVTPFLEAPLRRFGYKPVLLGGLGLVAVATALFPVWNHLVFWIALRFLAGVGDAALHFAAQTWIVSTARAHERGRMISLYGFFYGLGFGAGPLGINLLTISIWAPFVALLVLYGIAAWMVLLLQNGYPDPVESGRLDQNEGKMTYLFRYKEVLRLSWFALIPPFLFGYLEATMNSNFPVYALRMGITKEWVSVLLPSFVIGSLLLQLPLGILSDRIGRKTVLVSVCALGGLGFFFVPYLLSFAWGLLLLFLILGGLVGSTYSLGVAYAADLLPKALLPAANLLASFLFGIGSIAAAGINGVIIQFINGNLIFYLLSALYLMTALSGILSGLGAAREEKGKRAAEV